MTATREQIAKAVAAVKAEILEDVATGTVPATVPDFSALHDYVDANMYAEDDTALLWNDDAAEGDDRYAALNAMQTEVDEWIKAGGLRNAEHPVCVHCGEDVITRRGKLVGATGQDATCHTEDGTYGFHAVAPLVPVPARPVTASRRTVGLSTAGRARIAEIATDLGLTVEQVEQVVLHTLATDPALINVRYVEEDDRLRARLDGFRECGAKHPEMGGVHCDLPADCLGIVHDGDHAGQGIDGRVYWPRATD